MGGIGSGKSFAGSYDLLRRALPRRLYMAVAPTYPMLRDATLRTFLALSRELCFLRDFSKTDLIATLGNGAEVLFRSTDDPDRLRGPNLSGAFVDEASLCDREVYHVLIGRLREGSEQGWLSACFTPKGKSHWTYDLFGKRAPDTALYHARTADNPFLPAGFAATLARQYGGAESLLARQELGGEFLDLEGAEWPSAYFSGDDLWFDAWPEGLASRTSALDPSKGKDARKGDYAALVHLAADPAGVLWCEADLVRGRSAEWVADWTVEHCARFRPDLVGVESNQFLQLFCPLIAQSASRRGRTLPLVEIHNHAPKLVRIRRLGPYLCQRRVRFRDTPGTRLLVDQLREFPEGEHDDAPDALEMSLRLLEGLWAGAQQDDEDATVYRA